MRSIFLAAFYVFFLVSGFSAVFVFSLGYIWVDLFSPQQVGYSILNQIPLSLIVGTAAILGYVLFDRRDPPRLVFGLWLIGLWAIWITLTTLWAVVPTAAWEKWDWAIKTVIFAGFLPFVIRSRVQIEAMVLTIILSISGTMIASGVRTLFTGGGYEIKLGLLSGNSGLAEGSALATTSIAIIPLILYVRNHTLLIPRTPFFGWLCYGLIAAAILTTLGTYERTGIVALAVLAFFLWIQSRHKVLFALLAGVAGLIALGMISGDWYDRMTTIKDFRGDESALTRIAVWLWTLDYAVAHPLGGGFSAYLINHFRLPIEGTDDFLEINGRAFHSIYFEVLGEHGIVGLGIFAALIGCMFIYLRSVHTASRAAPQDAWLGELAKAVMVATLVYLAGGTFVGIAFQPMLYYFFALSICLQQYVARTNGVGVPTSGGISRFPAKPRIAAGRR